MQVRSVTETDIPIWQALSFEYDGYVKESAADLSQWYGGDDHSPAFGVYMRAKIAQKEAFIIVDCGGICQGIIAFSKRNNRISFFAVSHHADFAATAGALFDCAFAHLDISKDIGINEIISASEWMGHHEEFFLGRGFMFQGNSTENGVPVKTFVKLST